MTIAEWLAEPAANYHTGVLLYKRSNANIVLLSLFESGENSFTRSKLRDELKNLHKTEVVKSTINLVIDNRSKQHNPEPHNQDVLKPIIDLKNIRFKEMAAIHATLATLPTDEQRLMAAIRIDELDKLIDHCWHQINYYAEHKCLPPDEDIADVKTIGDVVKLSKNIPTYISKINVRLQDDKTGDEAAERLMLKKAKWQVILTKIERIMNEPIQI
jgi:hypothetical protein